MLAILGVIAAPITSGDTAFRSARLIVADFLGMEQKSIRHRLYICIPMFLASIGLLLYSLRDKDGFDMIWRYFAWANQTLSVFTLWAITVYLVREKKGHCYYVTYFPALFMTAVCGSYICIAPEGFGLSPDSALSIALITAALAALWFNIWYFKTTKKTLEMKRIRKSTGLTLALLIYVSATAAYFLPRNTEISNTEKYITVAASYLIVFVLWLVLRKKEALQRKRFEEDNKQH